MNNVHTWSHPPLTTQTNIQIVAELYWTLKAIKTATSVTFKCFRPPQGDVDDRVRAIAWQMGMRTILWDEDTEDWNLLAVNGGSLSPTVVDGYFNTWINNYKYGKDKADHIVLEHELNHATINMSISWLPKLKQAFNVIPALACNGITQPYWEDSFVYPLSNYPGTATAITTTTKATIITTKSTATTKTSTSITRETTATTKTTITSPPTYTAILIAGVSGDKYGDGDSGCCCTTSDYCINTCRFGACSL